MLKKYLNPIRMAVLTILQTLIAAHHIFLMIYVVFLSDHLTNLPTFAGVCGVVAILALPFIAGMVLANDAKWWLITLPIQLPLSVAVQYIVAGSPDTIRGKIYDAVVLLACQALGVGIKLLFMRLKSKKLAQ